jgi:hypothetical protein
MSTPYQNEERRFALRMALRLPIVVSGRSDDGAAWSEPTETDDISTSGALFHLNQKVSVGEKLYIRAHKTRRVTHRSDGHRGSSITRNLRHRARRRANRRTFRKLDAALCVLGSGRTGSHAERFVNSLSKSKTIYHLSLDICQLFICRLTSARPRRQINK